jgi:hypothetical protein
MAVSVRVGLLAAVCAQASETFRLRAKRLIPLGVAGAALGVASVIGVLDPIHLLFRASAPVSPGHTFLSPARVIEFLATVLAFHRLYPVIEKVLGGLFAPSRYWGVTHWRSLRSVPLYPLWDNSSGRLSNRHPLDSILVSTVFLVLIFTAWLANGALGPQSRLCGPNAAGGPLFRLPHSLACAAKN